MNRRLVKGASAGGRAFFFVVVALVSWWLFASLADSVVRCAPWGTPWGFLRQCGPVPAARTRSDNILLVVMLLPALWVAQRVWFPEHPDEEEQVDQRKERGPEAFRRTA
jgi:hypothetical protein